jgi:hypothetical protein
VSENLIENIAPHLAPPVVRESIQSAGEAAVGAELSFPPVIIPFVLFSADGADSTD